VPPQGTSNLREAKKPRSQEFKNDAIRLDARLLLLLEFSDSRLLTPGFRKKLKDAIVETDIGSMS
jgi:hypothetical protein